MTDLITILPPSKTDDTGCVIVPPFDVLESLQTIRIDYDPDVAVVTPHISLLYPFVPPEQFDAAEEKLRDALADIEPFEVSFSDFGCFFETCTVFLVPRPKRNLVELQRRLQACFPGFDDVQSHPSGYVPHLTLGRVANRSQAQLFMELAEENWAPVRFHVDSVQLLRRDDGGYRIDRNIAFGGPA